MNSATKLSKTGRERREVIGMRQCPFCTEWITRMYFHFHTQSCPQRFRQRESIQHADDCELAALIHQLSTNAGDAKEEK